MFCNYRDLPKLGTITALTISSQKVSQSNLLFFGDFFPSGVWRPFDGEMILWSPWWVGDHPDGGRDHNCGRVALAESSNAGKWASGDCEYPHRYICERGF